MIHDVVNKMRHEVKRLLEPRVEWPRTEKFTDNSAVHSYKDGTSVMKMNDTVYVLLPPDTQEGEVHTEKMVYEDDDVRLFVSHAHSDGRVVDVAIRRVRKDENEDV